jgi:hypothetical protein
VAFAVGGTIMGSAQDRKLPEAFVTVGAVLVLGGIGFALYMGAGIAKKCPRCLRIFAGRDVGVADSHHYGQHETVTRKDIVRDTHGRQVGEVERQEQVVATYSSFDVRVACKHCGHQWTEHRKYRSETGPAGR